jgi:hypothetical protein
VTINDTHIKDATAVAGPFGQGGVRIHTEAANSDEDNYNVNENYPCWYGSDWQHYPSHTAFRMVSNADRLLYCCDRTSNTISNISVIMDEVLKSF